MESNEVNSKKLFPTYSREVKNLKFALETYWEWFELNKEKCDLKSPEEFLEESSKEQKEKDGTFLADENKFIESFDGCNNEINNQYYGENEDKLKFSWLKDVAYGKTIGTGNKEIQRTGINCTALSILVNNRLTKVIERIIDIRKKSISAQSEMKMREEIAKSYERKDNGIVKLLSELYIYNSTMQKNFYSYGYDKDTNGNRRKLIIDLPELGQVSVHFGSKQSFEDVLSRSRELTKDILEKRIESLINGDIQNGEKKIEKLNKAINNLSKENLLPKYDGKLYEYMAGFPIKYSGKLMQEQIESLDLQNATEIIDNSLKSKDENGKKTMSNIFRKMCNIKLGDRDINEREIHYLAVTLGFSKTHLKILDKYISMKKNKESNFKQFAEDCVDEHSKEERMNVSKLEEKYMENDKEKNFRDGAENR